MPILLRCLLGFNKTAVILQAHHPLGFFFVFYFAFLSWLTSLSCQNHFLETARESGFEASRFVNSVHQRRAYLLEGPGKAWVLAECSREGGWQNGAEDEDGNISRGRLPSTQTNTDPQISESLLEESRAQKRVPEMR